MAKKAYKKVWNPLEKVNYPVKLLFARPLTFKHG